MTKHQLQVEEFHLAFGLTVNYRPTIPSEKDIQLRRNLINEEAKEFNEAETIRDVKDALGDLLYVFYGAAITYGIDLEPVVDEIHRSNMSKMWTDEEIKSLPEDCTVANTFSTKTDRRHVVKRKADGKVIKSPSYSPAKLD
jgi:predicted HAD superfamily Cof-like phosphohydrolase